MKFKTEDESIVYLINQLVKSGYTDVECTSGESKFSHYDVRSKNPINGTSQEYEIKRRDFKSDKYEDCIMEDIKYHSFLNDKHNGDTDTGWLVNFYDDCWTVSDVYNPINFTKTIASHCTEFKDKKKIIKGYYHYKFDYRYEY